MPQDWLSQPGGPGLVSSFTPKGAVNAWVRSTGSPLSTPHLYLGVIDT